MDRYDEMNKKFMSKAALVGAEVQTVKLPSRTYELVRYETTGDILVIPPFISRINALALYKSHSLKRIVFPNTLTSLQIQLPDFLEQVNIPDRVGGIYRIGEGAEKLILELSGCKKSIETYSLYNIEDLNIKNSHLIGRIWGNGMYKDNIRELRLISTRIDRRSILNCRINKLFLSQYTQTEEGSFHCCKINYLYYFVETQEQANRFMHDIMSGSWKISMLSNCIINHVIPIIEPNLCNYIN